MTELQFFPYEQKSFLTSGRSHLPSVPYRRGYNWKELSVESEINPRPGTKTGEIFIINLAEKN